MKPKSTRERKGRTWERKYSKALIKKAQKMWANGFGARVIMGELGFENYWDVYYHCKKGRKESQMEYSMKNKLRKKQS